MNVPNNKLNITVSMRALIFGFMVLHPNALFAQSSGNGLLQSLDTEAQQIKLDADTEIPPEALERKGTLEASSKNGGGRIAQITPGMSVEEFQQVLKNNYMGSYLFYRRLSEEKQAAVFQFYQQNPDSNLIREEILRLSK